MQAKECAFPSLLDNNVIAFRFGTSTEGGSNLVFVFDDENTDALSTAPQSESSCYLTKKDAS
jgi:hypothetical protein